MEILIENIYIIRLIIKIKNRKEVVKFELPNNLNKGKYNVEIFAIDSFDNISEPKIGVIEL